MVLRRRKDLTEMGNESTTTEELWELLGERLKSFILRRVSDEQVAEDLDKLAERLQRFSKETVDNLVAIRTRSLALSSLSTLKATFTP